MLMRVRGLLSRQSASSGCTSGRAASSLRGVRMVIPNNTLWGECVAIAADWEVAFPEGCAPSQTQRVADPLGTRIA